jgi:hypothetical protein
MKFRNKPKYEEYYLLACNYAVWNELSDVSLEFTASIFMISCLL